MDVVYILGHQDEYEELRYSLRALSTNLPHGNVWIAGAPPPPWVRNVAHIPVVQEPGYPIHWTNQRRNILAACDHPDVSERFLFMNDDFFFVAPLDAVPLPPHRGPMRVFYGPPRTPLEQRRGSPEAELFFWLIDHGVDEPLDFPQHVPTVMDKAPLAAWMRAVWHINAFPVSTLWGNMAGLESPQGSDFILKRPEHRTWPDSQWAVSTSNRAFALWEAGKRLRAMFPDPSPYEQEAA